MKFTPEVVAALAVLRDAAENDFERHRLDVLERDLTSPQQIEIVDDKHQRFNGRMYRQGTGGHFYYHEPLHRAIWEYVIGDIPKGYVVHHVDRDKANNAVENLQCMTAAAHHKIHAPTSHHAPIQAFVCKTCGKVFIAENNGRNCFCSSKCFDMYHAAEDVCPVCGKTFKHNKYHPQKFCSRQCMYKAKTIEAAVVRTCPVCGKEFTTKKGAKKIFCSKSCANKVNRQKRAEKNQSSAVLSPASLLPAVVDGGSD